jgi:hypothetical protein
MHEQVNGVFLSLGSPYKKEQKLHLEEIERYSESLRVLFLYLEKSTCRDFPRSSMENKTSDTTTPGPLQPSVLSQALEFCFSSCVE